MSLAGTKSGPGSAQMEHQSSKNREQVCSRLTSGSLAEARIQSAQAEGQFDNLPGFGKPIPGIDEPHDELWWVKDKLKREQLSNLPPALAIRLDVEKTLERILAGTAPPTEAEVREEIAALNERIRKASFAVTWGPAVDVQPLDVEDVVARWRDGAGRSASDSGR
jgi:hypothetical protein